MNQNNNPYMLEQLQTLLLKEDRKKIQQLQHNSSEINADIHSLQNNLNHIKSEINSLNENYENPEKLNQKLTPLINIKIAELKENFYDAFGFEVKQVVKKELKESQDEFIELFYPIIGKMINKYMKYQFDSFLDSISERLQNTFSIKHWWKNLKALISGIKPEEIALKSALNPHIEEIFIIHIETGLLIASYSRNNTSDVDLIAPVLTAIKNFAEDAFSQKSDSLEVIQYNNYKIILNSFHKYYVATIVSGNLTTEFKIKLNEHLLNFSQNKMPAYIQEIDSILHENISNKLKHSFQEFE